MGQPLKRGRPIGTVLPIPRSTILAMIHNELGPADLSFIQGIANKGIRGDLIFTGFRLTIIKRPLYFGITVTELGGSHRIKFYCFTKQELFQAPQQALPPEEPLEISPDFDIVEYMYPSH